MKNINKISEIEKLYGYRIPCKENYKYYLELLALTDPNVLENINNLSIYEERTGDLKNAKFKTLDRLVEHFKMLFNNPIEYEPVSLQTKDTKYLDKHVYVSIDIREANFTIAKKYHGLELPRWERYLTETLGVDISLASSKSFRQMILGQVLNKKIISLEKVETFHKLKSIDPDLVVGINQDEIILDITGKEFDTLSVTDDLWKAEVFEMNIIENYGENVMVKTFLNGKKKFYAVNGNNYYIHYKTLILNQPLQTLDTIIKYDNTYFERIVRDGGLVQREYRYIDKYVDICRVENDYLSNGKRIYSISDHNLIYCHINKETSWCDIDDLDGYIKQHFIDLIKSFLM
jgi:hypothetical protein